MGLQLIICVETNKANQSDWIYVKETLNHYYERSVEFKYSPVFMDGKSKYNSTSVKREITSLIKNTKPRRVIIFRRLSL